MYTEKENNAKFLNNPQTKVANLNKIPKCINVLKNIPVPDHAHMPMPPIHKKSLVSSKQSSSTSIKNTNCNSRKSSSGKNVPLIQDKNILLSIHNLKKEFWKSRGGKLNLGKRINSSEKKKKEKKEEFSYTIRKPMNIDQIYKYKIEYNLIKENITKILSNQVNSNEMSITNKIMEDIIPKLKKILEIVSDKIKEKNEQKDKKENNNNKENYNKKLLELYKEKYKKLKEINTEDILEKKIQELKDVEQEINFYENENKILLLDNKVNINTNTNGKGKNNFKTFTLPNITQKRKINKIKELDSTLNGQLKSKIEELKKQISQELLISKKIKDNELIINKHESIINELNIKYNNLLNNYNKCLNLEENVKNLEEKNKKKPKNELRIIEKRRILKLNKTEGVEPLLDKDTKDSMSLSKETKNITLENHSKLSELNVLCLPCPVSKFTKKNLSCVNITNNVSKNKKIKELILKNLDRKEKEEKAMINIHENDTFSTNKYRHIKLKPNFSFNNDYQLFKEERIKSIPKLKSSIENKYNIISNFYNTEKDNGELINESIYIEESNDKNDKTNNNNNNINEKSRKINRIRKIPEIIGRNNDNEIQVFSYIKNKKINLEEKKNDLDEQREKVLNTIMYDNIVELGNNS